MERLDFQIVVDNIKKYMKQKNKSLNTISKETEIPYSTLQSILNGDTKDMKLSNAEKICACLDITLDELMCTEEEIKHQRELALKNIKFATVSSLGLNLEGLTLEDINELQRIANYMKNKK